MALKRCSLCNNKLGITAQTSKRPIKYCRKCYYKSPNFLVKVSKGWFKKGEKSKNWNGFKKGRATWNKGKKLGYRVWNKGKKHKVNGESHWNWQGGKTNKREKARKSVKYKNWRKLVFKKDNHTCRDCKKRGGNLYAHHIKSFSDYPKLRYKVENGETLCINCHSKRHPNLNFM